MTIPVIQVEGLTKCYGHLAAVDNLSFAVPAGRTCGLLGGNGAGKTTTLAARLYGSAVADIVRQAFVDRGIL